MLVELEQGRPLLFMADVSYTAEAYASDLQAGFHNDPVAGVRSIRRIKRLAKEWGAEVIFTHDAEVFKGYALAPEPFTGSEVLSTAGGGQ
jgi:4-pyridoxolactonase